MNTAQFAWMAIHDRDLADIDRLATDIHPGLRERPEVFAEKIRLFPEGCKKLVIDGRIFGYGIAHPWELYEIPKLDAFLEILPLSPGCLYIHDVAVHPSARGMSALKFFFKATEATAISKGIRKLACVSVYETNELWSRFGFKVFANDEISGKLKSYGDTAKYMIADI